MAEKMVGYYYALVFCIPYMLVYLYIATKVEMGMGRTHHRLAKPVINVQYEVKSLRTIKETRYHRCFILPSLPATQNQTAEASSTFSLLPLTDPLQN